MIDCLGSLNTFTYFLCITKPFRRETVLNGLLAV